MEQFINTLEHVVEYIARIGVPLTEIVGIAIVLSTVIRAIIGITRRSPKVRLRLAYGILLALEFKLGGEVLRTVVARDWNDLLVLGVTILLRAALTLLLYWEIKHEEPHAAMPEAIRKLSKEKPQAAS
ncbi:MAG: DUF1622 domain-containing protein [Clostridia bacterium]|nr:DUF1622 domain-containing protein [Clostridia bacterium]